MRLSNDSLISPELRRMYIRAAKQLYYDDKCIEEIKAAKKIGELAVIMKNARHRAIGDTY